MFCAFYTATKDLADVKRELVNFVKWSDLGLNLGLSPESLEVIKEDHRLTSHRLEAVLLQWLKQNYSVDKYGLPSWSRLSDVVDPFDHALASTIKERHT